MQAKLNTNEANGQLKLFPISLFGSVMGLSGLALGWRIAFTQFHAPFWISQAISVIAILDFILVAIVYAMKVMRHNAHVIEEFLHPISGSFFGTFTIALLLLSSVVFPYNSTTGEVIWIIGVILTIAMAYISFSRLLGQKINVLHATPAWIIPGVGVLDVPVTSGDIPFPWVHQVNLLSFAIGSVLALMLLILIFARLIYQEPIPKKLTPSLMILFAPFSVGFLGYVDGIRHQHIDLFASMLFYFGLFMFCVMYFRVFFRKDLTFGPAWWAVSFPMAALANSSLEYAAYLHTEFMNFVSLFLLGLVTLTIVWLAIRSLLHQSRGTFLVG
ncbi:hypothetical protein AN477_01960 [Alicyclobacillus ferrooxydans]|uniref:C4-dicarboxylate ABC transporter n=2 Tax=Alicyclobacillus ferrooxydans TaxID=471514 RepID=A0A0P9CJD3_9BACL|nr:hypothetical protein AN477_01960 [Alicyclobacillus ferrooxydans]